MWSGGGGPAISAHKVPAVDVDYGETLKTFGLRSKMDDFERKKLKNLILKGKMLILIFF